MSIEYVPHSRIELTFSTHRVTVSGRDIGRVYREIQLQRCAVVEETGRAAALAGAAPGIVEVIDVTDRRHARKNQQESDVASGVE